MSFAVEAVPHQHLSAGDFTSPPLTGTLPTAESLTAPWPGQLSLELELIIPSRQLQLFFKFMGEVPGWLGELLSRLGQLLALPPRWDSRKAKQIPLETVSRLLSLLSHVTYPVTPAPQLVPRSDGGLQLEWHTQGVDIEIAVPVEGPVEAIRYSPGSELEEEWKGSLSGDLTKLSGWIRMMSDPPVRPT